MRKSFLSLLFILSTVLSSSTSAASIERPAAGGGAARDTVAAVIGGPDDIAVGRTVILDASASRISGERTQYTWSIDETKQVIGRNVEAIFTPERAGKLTFRLTLRTTDLRGKVTTSEALHPVIVFKRKIVLIADASVPSETIDASVRKSLLDGVYIKVIRTADGTPQLVSEDAIFALLSEQKQLLSNAEDIVIWSDGIAGLQAFLRYVQGDSERKAIVQNQTVVLLTTSDVGTIARSSRGAYGLLRPEEIIITGKEALEPIVGRSSTSNIGETLSKQNIDWMSLNATTSRIMPWDIFSIIVNYLLSHGVSGQTVILLLMLPVIATIFSFLKQVVGITTFGLYTPTIVTLSFLALGTSTALFFLLFTLAVGYSARLLMRRMRLLYIPKVAIILTVVSASLLFLVALSTWFGLSFTRETVFILLMLSTQTENFLNLKTEEGWWSAVVAVVETVIGAVLCVAVVQWQALQSIVLAYPELIAVTVLINVLLGRWTGLRLVEYFRFREVFRHMRDEE